MDALINVNGENFQTLQILLLTTLITLLPSIVVMMTSFTRYIISLSFLRSAIGLQQNPPNMVLVGMALFLTLFTMSPVISDIQTNAYEPYIAERITQEEFYEKAKVPLKEFMLDQTEDSSLELFCELAGADMPATRAQAEGLPLRIILYDQRTQARISDRILPVYSLCSDRCGGGVHLDVYGNDHAAALHDLHAI